MRITITLLAAFLIAASFPVSLLAVDISFSEPSIIESDPGPFYPADEIIDAGIRVTVVKTCTGPTYDLVLSHNYTYLGCMINRVDHGGNLVDSASLYVRHLDLAGDGSQTYSFKEATWSAPYYYILTLFEDKIYYTRITEDLTLIDAEPVEYIDKPRRIYSDGDYVWTTNLSDSGDYFINRFHLPDPTPTFDDIIVPSTAANADHIATGDGIWFCDRYYGDTTFYPAHIDRFGQLTIMDSVKNEITGSYIPYYNFCLIPYDTNTAYFCWFERPDYGDYQFQYIKLSPTSPSTTESEMFELDSLSREFLFRTKGFQKANGELSFAASYNNSIVAYVSFDPILAQVTNAGTIPGTEGYTDPRAFDSHDSLLLMYNIINDNVEVGAIDPDNPFADYSTGQVLFQSSHYNRPTLLADSSGVLLYNQRSTNDSVSIIGYRLDITQDPPSPLYSQNVIFIDSAHRAPWLYDLGDRKALFWHEYTDRYRGRLLFFNSDFPSYYNIDDRVNLYTPGREHPPELLRIDTLLYIAQFRSWSYSAYELVLYSSLTMCNLVDNTWVPWGRSISSAGRFALVAHKDTAAVAMFWNFCNDPGPAACREYYCGYHGILWKDTTMSYFGYNEPTGGCGYGFDSYGDGYSDIFGVEFGGEHLIWRENSLSLMKANTANQTFDRVVDLPTASGVDLGYSSYHPFTINPVKIDDGYAVFMVNNLEPWESHLLVFDNSWNFKGHAMIPIEASARDFSQFEYCPQDGRIYFAYSAYFSKPYASARVMIQSASIENVTDIKDDPTGLPRQFSLAQNSPNPFNASTKIEFYLPRQSEVNLAIFNVLGQKVTTLLNTSLPPGEHEIFWDGADSFGRTVASGVYFYKISDGESDFTRKMMLLK